MRYLQEVKCFSLAKEQLKGMLEGHHTLYFLKKETHTRGGTYIQKLAKHTAVLTNSSSLAVPASDAFPDCADLQFPADVLQAFGFSGAQW